ncbi:uncharacterized protein EAE98_003515 [Botrytis deweyae]|uniref:Uncharacterized protein n=1 Tax=Botrytis deweyae TaxID=2478750 RepID=A0ABQ7ITW3_9HELO|nr:uncharacterized protein EAE98_003515 [Botrytis deweyae]KAF7929650.1 hypothetical protein EAE99_004554 [Botrytis elliptica]KAF7933806.1 hypothetical protein EAE98_003515 [Botrytis deweyae]
MIIRATYPNKLKLRLVISGGVLVPLCSHGDDNMECNIGSVTRFLPQYDTRVIRVRGEAKWKIADLIMLLNFEQDQYVNSS